MRRTGNDSSLLLCTCTTAFSKKRHTRDPYLHCSLGGGQTRLTNMAAAVNMPNIKSGRILQISELGEWAPDDVHGNAVRVLGR